MITRTLDFRKLRVLVAKHPVIKQYIVRLDLKKFRKIISQSAHYDRRIKHLKVACYFCYQHNGGQRSAHHCYQESYHPDKHHITDIFIPYHSALYQYEPE